MLLNWRGVHGRWWNSAHLQSLVRPFALVSPSQVLTLLNRRLKMTGSELLDAAKRHIAEVGRACRRSLAGPAVIEAGPAEGLRFDAGPDTVRFEKGDYEYPVQQALASLARPSDVCYDIGANLGFFSILLGRIVGPTGVVHAFEPVPRNAAAIERNARLNHLENISVLRLALSCADGDGELLLARHVGGAVLKGAGVPPDLVGSLRVKTASLDRLVERGQVRLPDIVKIDVEGAEMDVLQGMENVLRRGAPTLILELDDETADGCERKVAACQAFLRELGYRSERLPNSYKDGRWFVRHFLAMKGEASLAG